MSYLASLFFGVLSVGMAMLAGYGVGQHEAETDPKEREVDKVGVWFCTIVSLGFLLAALMVAVTAK